MGGSQKPRIPHSDPALARGPVLRNNFSHNHSLYMYDGYRML